MIGIKQNNNNLSHRYWKVPDTKMRVIRLCTVFLYDYFKTVEFGKNKLSGKFKTVAVAQNLNMYTHAHL